MTHKEPADWAKIKAYRVVYATSNVTDAFVTENWGALPCAAKELARMYDKYETPPANPDGMAARDWVNKTRSIFKGHCKSNDLFEDLAQAAFHGGIKHGRANP